MIKKAGELILASFLATLGIVGIMGHYSNGFYQRFPAKIAAPKIGWIGDCENKLICVKGNPESDFKVLLVGDSHAMHLGSGLLDVGREGIRLDIVASGGCVFSGADANLVHAARPSLCNDQRRLIGSLSQDYDQVIYAQRWGGYPPDTFSDQTSNEEFLKKLSELSEKKLTVAGAAPNNPTLCQQRQFLLGENNEGCPRDSLDIFTAAEQNFIASRFPNAAYFSVGSSLACGPECDVAFSYRSPYFDNHHLSDFGSLWVARDLLW